MNDQIVFGNLFGTGPIPSAVHTQKSMPLHESLVWMWSDMHAGPSLDAAAEAGVPRPFSRPSERSDVFDDVITYIYPSDVLGIMAVVNVTQARNDLFNMVNRVQDGEKITITSKNCNAVLMSEEEYDSLLETLYLLSDPDMAADLDRTRRTPISEMEVWECPDTQ